MNLTKIQLALWLMVAAATLGARLPAGQESHGGDAVICNGKDPVVLDYYHAALPTFDETVVPIPDISAWTRQQTVDYLVGKLKGYLFVDEVQSALTHLGDVDRWITADLKDVNDGNEPYLLPKECVRKQLAVRQGEQVYIDPAYASKMTQAQLGILQFHEAVFYVAVQHGLVTSEYVRNLVRVLLRKDSTADDVVRAIHLLRGKAYLFQLLEGARQNMGFSPEEGESPMISFERVDAEHRRLEARLWRPNSYLPGPTAELTCAIDGITCTVDKPSADGVTLGKVGQGFRIEEGGTRLHFVYNNVDFYYFRRNR